MKKLGSQLTIFSSLQWFFFIFANTLVVPISIASAFELPPDMMETCLRSSLFFTGLACVVQGWAGHRFPIMEGHSGLLWGVMINLALSGSALGLSLTRIGGGIATGVILACMVTILIAAFNGIGFIQSVFSPMVMSVYLFLLSFQLIFIFFKGMFPVSQEGTILVYQSLFSLAVVVFVSVLKLKGAPIISNFSVLIGIVFGWLFYDFFFSHSGSTVFHSADYFPMEWFPLGKPNLEIGIVTVAFFAVILNISNTIASLRTVCTMVKQTASKRQHRNSLIFTSVFTAIGSVLGLVPFTPFTSSIGFLQSSRIYNRKPFLIGGGLISLIGLLPVFVPFLATMPISVGNAVLFVAYLQLFGTAYNSLEGKQFNSNTIFRIAVPVLMGLSLMTIEPHLFSSLPLFVQPFISNGLIVGMILSILLERVVKWERYETAVNENQ